MFKYIVMDMDGTLLNSKNEISENTKNILLSYQKKGTQLILASGRSYHRLLDIARSLDMFTYGGYFIEVDGIGYYDVKNDIRHILKTMEVHEFKELVSYLMSLEVEVEVQVCQENALYAYIPPCLIPIKEKLKKEWNLDKDHPLTAGPWKELFDMRIPYKQIHYFQNVNEIKGISLKVQIMDYEEKIEEVYQLLNQKFKGQYEFFRTSYRQIEILPFGYSKGKTLQRIMKINHVSSREVIAFGDGENDISLFEVADYSYAMGNARDYVKEKAKFVTKTNDEEGIAYILKQG
ncbi:Cof-type HAD-IIB family hydrolase [Floccifex sp.]|uniref:Cof-type HAD-IIB family hydrolase n=1 Tax=Floccifex sp. TaxID=2815810 RepID=UPI003F0A8986